MGIRGNLSNLSIPPQLLKNFESFSTLSAFNESGSADFQQLQNVAKQVVGGTPQAAGGLLGDVSISPTCLGNLTMLTTNLTLGNQFALQCKL